ncbi:unnamed protein product, partial [Ectocarpus sp. 8 AP-2014]
DQDQLQTKQGERIQRSPDRFQAHHAVLEAAETTNNNTINKGQGPAEDHHQVRKLSILPKANTRDQNCPAALAATHSKKEKCLLRHYLSSRPTSM